MEAGNKGFFRTEFKRSLYPANITVLSNDWPGAGPAAKALSVFAAGSFCVAKNEVACRSPHYSAAA
ncbi:hypothetical protein VN24_20035 [Paenibacillus beijingensis]|uniref:Uncharacterized protein n=1 Tax=Paenibacillus beijingensis TaxID=1126833 RepID=A0A0D5NME4_9BACL|nr:hypothetical protein VN24_20035 [Paenibacillus beijingensis]